MPALDNILEKNIRLIDYEKITDVSGHRLVAFGRFAGIAGTIDLLSFSGKFLLKRGYSTPLLNICTAHESIAYRRVNFISDGVSLHERGGCYDVAEDDRVTGADTRTPKGDHPLRRRSYQQGPQRGWRRRRP